ncbi:hypothetical protein PMI22_00479 [Pseudomonas sp. GM21]|uniref:hypothetical protein n=1 Tax=Pseudomonas sp. GM21 TaxID=1144325 RepID=UPI000272289D|nr:hypothetical protein [Pseudomonas sp. GM21]EJM25133.1 hypothetical protein PMI22_00479 [Pseudomonas sp. GM21]
MGRAKEKNATADYRSLSIVALHRAGMLRAGYDGSWEWKRRGEVVGAIDVESESQTRLRLRYRVTTKGEAELKDYPVPITWTPCHLGGNRPWFLCPCCGRRVAKLYLRRVFACRHCLHLNYASQQANKRDRAADLSSKLRRSLSCPGGYLSIPAELIPKPKGMHWRTFGQKVKQLKRVDARALVDAGALFASIERSLGQAYRAFASV